MLKRFFCVIILSMLIFTARMHAQSAVYFCASTGSYGFCYGAASEMAARECAYTNCIKSGGEKPEVIDFSTKKGYGAICIGEDYLGTKVIGVALGCATQDDADDLARQQCVDKGGNKIRIKERWNDD